MKTVYCLFLGLVLSLFAGCTTSQHAPPAPDILAITLSGDNRTPFSGFYIRDGQRMEVSGTVPWTFTMEGVSRLEIRKLNPDYSISAEVHYKSRGSDFSNTMAVPSGTTGLRIDVRHGFSMTAIKE